MPAVLSVKPAGGQGVTGCAKSVQGASHPPPLAQLPTWPGTGIDRAGSASAPQRPQKRRKIPGASLTSGARNGNTAQPRTQRTGGNGTAIPPHVASTRRSEENRAPIKIYIPENQTAHKAARAATQRQRKAPPQWAGQRRTPEAVKPPGLLIICREATREKRR